MNKMIPSELLSTAKTIINKINQSNSILISSHIRPDGDAIGSVSGLLKSLLKAGIKNIEVALADGIPDRFAFVWPSDFKIIQNTQIDSKHDLVLLLDSGEENRSGITFNRDKELTCLINIDHHASNTNFGDINYVDEKASSTCEIITALLELASFPIDEDVASSLMLGLITDSRSFQNEGIRYTAHMAAATLLKAGADTKTIYSLLNSDRSEADLRVQGFGLSNFKLESNDKLGVLIIKDSDLKQLNANTDNVYASGVFNMMLAMKNTLASVVVFPGRNGVSSCEFRSRGGINVKDVAVALGGGGHIPASGCSQNIPIEQLANKAIELMKKQIEETD
ncbi:MAG: bifunctional oligoribonuclease/PAP phosphatase NrnA [Candidatus Riflebacteria bacterium]|nr:bifunctional oligoribonuclease/PAP phosphatase NrnA [Candidatus Riflebacteria bacterium]